MSMKNPSHPGELIRDICVDGLQLSITEGAAALGVARTTLSRLINGKAKVSPEMAVRLSKAFGSTAGFWLRLQLNFDLAQIEKRASTIQVRRVAAPEERPAL
ncbi:MAG: HigA family addiction module antitoxin [Desulfatirhabdiaceae bacterium]